jgi:hypothetical protein
MNPKNRCVLAIIMMGSLLRILGTPQHMEFIYVLYILVRVLLKKWIEMNIIR